jgi:PTH1 family peptidyl-tRNA hydrolase
VGFRVAAELASRLGVSLKKRLFRPYAAAFGRHRDSKIFLVEPLTFMNASGKVFPGIMRTEGLAISDILVICDSLDLSPGSCRLRLQGSAGGHNGLQSIIGHVGTEGFMRLLIGIGRPAHKEDVIEYVLGKPDGEQEPLISRAVVRAADAVLALVENGPSKVMNEINRREPLS